MAVHRISLIPSSDKKESMDSIISAIGHAKHLACAIVMAAESISPNDEKNAIATAAGILEDALEDAGARLESIWRERR